MTKKIALWFIGILFLLVGLWYCLIRGGIFLSPTEFKAAEKLEKAANAVSNDGGSVEGTLVTDQGVTKPEGMSAADWMRYLKFHAALVSANRSINLYVKCIDQFGNPAEGLKANITILGNEPSIANLVGGVATSSQSKEVIPVIVGPDGMITIEEKRGSSLILEIPYSEEFSLGRGKEFKYGSLVATKESKDFYKPDKNNPVIYNIWRRGPKQALFYWNGKRGLISNRTPDRFSKLTNMLEDASSRSIPPRETSVLLDWTRLPDAAGKTRRWSMTVEAGGGGVIQSDLSEEHGCLAPEDGYSPVIKLDSDSYSEESDRGRHWFYRSADKKIHATFRLRVEPNATGEIPIIYLEEIKSNTTGSRNLEYFPDKTLNTY